MWGTNFAIVFFFFFNISFSLFRVSFCFEPSWKEVISERNGGTKERACFRLKL